MKDYRVYLCSLWMYLLELKGPVINEAARKFKREHSDAFAKVDEAYSRGGVELLQTLFNIPRVYWGDGIKLTDLAPVELAVQDEINFMLDQEPIAHPYFVEFQQKLPDDTVVEFKCYVWGNLTNDSSKSLGICEIQEALYHYGFLHRSSPRMDAELFRKLAKNTFSNTLLLADGTRVTYVVIGRLDLTIGNSINPYYEVVLELTDQTGNRTRYTSFFSSMENLLAPANEFFSKENLKKKFIDGY